MSWDGLVAAALLGTERRRPQPDGDPVLAAIDWGDPEGALLASAAVLGTARAAGARPARIPAPEPAPAEDLPLCSPEADAVLARVLAEAPPLLEEWLDRAVAAGIRARPRRLPELLAEASHDRSLRGRVLRAGGRRGSWLAAQSRDWSWAAKDPADPEAWETGTREERLAMLKAVRERDPAAGRRLVATTWASDSAEDRRAFVEALATGLSLDDEPLLERALDMRHAATRRAAAEVLARLPESAYGARMAARLAPLISVSGTLRKRIEVELPAAFEADMERDGMRAKGAPRELGDRGWWLRQIVTRAPLRVWTESLSLPPGRILELARGERELLLGIYNAVSAQRDREWALALAEATGDLPLDLPAEAAAPAVRALAGRARELTEVFGLVARAEGPWDVGTSHAILDAIDRAKVAATRQWLRRSDVVPLARRLDPALLERAAAALSRHDGAGISPDAVGEALAVLDLRHAIMREIRT